jgi:hypothetical protein
MGEFERIIADSMGPFFNMYGEEIMTDDLIEDLNMNLDEYSDLDDYYPEDFQGEEEFA